ncbi:MAG: hypothetical protein U0625_07025 [Phycisphaerales bacterium]
MLSEALMSPPDGMQVESHCGDRLVVLYRPARSKGSPLGCLSLFIPLWFALLVYPTILSLGGDPKYPIYGVAFGWMVGLLLIPFLIYERYATVRFVFEGKSLRVQEEVGWLRWSQLFERSRITKVQVATADPEGDSAPTVQLFIYARQRRRVLWEGGAGSVCPWMARIVSEWSGAPVIRSVGPWRV